jgi:4,5-dihydroxyphthalate decarboxylase
MRATALLGEHPVTRAVRTGAITSGALSLDFADVPTPNQAFKRVVRDLEFDVAELALMTFLMARSRDVPLRLLPVVVFSRNPLPHLICRTDPRPLRPVELAGRRVGVRAYTTTTAVWVRALLDDVYGLDTGKVEWVTHEEGHVAGVREPANVRRDPSHHDLVGMLATGAVDAAIVDPVPSDPRFVPVVAETDGAHRLWQQQWRARTINHVVVVRESIAHDRAAVSELFRLFRESRERAADDMDLASAPIGLEANRRNLEVAISVARRQGLLARALTVEDLITDAIASLD